MSVLPILTYPDPLLAQKSLLVETFDEGLAAFVRDLTETMYASHGIGLSAVQVGRLLRVIVVDVQYVLSGIKKPRVLINPVITKRSGRIAVEEGCLSVPTVKDDGIPRSREVVVEAKNEKGEPFAVNARELLSVCIQHEIDHCDGKLFIDRLPSAVRKEALAFYRGK